MKQIALTMVEAGIVLKGEKKVSVRIQTVMLGQDNNKEN